MTPDSDASDSIPYIVTGDWLAAGWITADQISSDAITHAHLSDAAIEWFHYNQPPKLVISFEMVEV